MVTHSWGKHQLSQLSKWRSTHQSLAFASPQNVSCLRAGEVAALWYVPSAPWRTLPPSPKKLCPTVKPKGLQHPTYSGTAPKSGTARASAAKILQYSRLEFWILHSWRFKQESQGPVPPCANQPATKPWDPPPGKASLGPAPSCSPVPAVKGQVSGKL